MWLWVWVVVCLVCSWLLADFIELSATAQSERKNANTTHTNAHTQRGTHTHIHTRKQLQLEPCHMRRTSKSMQRLQQLEAGPARQRAVACQNIYCRQRDREMSQRQGGDIETERLLLKASMRSCRRIKAVREKATERCIKCNYHKYSGRLGACWLKVFSGCFHVCNICTYFEDI